MLSAQAFRLVRRWPADPLAGIDVVMIVDFIMKDGEIYRQDGRPVMN